jgi:hypothetical protein
MYALGTKLYGSNNRLLGTFSNNDAALIALVNLQHFYDPQHRRKLHPNPSDVLIQGRVRMQLRGGMAQTFGGGNTQPSS